MGVKESGSAFGEAEMGMERGGSISAAREAGWFPAAGKAAAVARPAPAAHV